MAIKEDHFQCQGEDFPLDQTEDVGLPIGTIKGKGTGIIDQELVEVFRAALGMIESGLDQVRIEDSGRESAVTGKAHIMIGVLGENIDLMTEGSSRLEEGITEIEILQDTGHHFVEDLGLLCMEEILLWEQ